jgi:hypothetical protein
MSTNAINPAAAASISLAGMDLETALMAVQMNRANLLETQLKDQMAAVQGKNDQIAGLNIALGKLNGLAALWGPGDGADKRLGNENNVKNLAVDAAREALVSVGMRAETKPFVGDGSTTKGEVDKLVQTVKSSIDAMSNSQQTDMLRLQSLSNKRNEAFEIMTNFIKKMNDNRSAIVSNMR